MAAVMLLTVFALTLALEQAHALANLDFSPQTTESLVLLFQMPVTVLRSIRVLLHRQRTIVCALRFQHVFLDRLTRRLPHQPHQIVCALMSLFANFKQPTSNQRLRCYQTACASASLSVMVMTLTRPLRRLQHPIESALRQLCAQQHSISLWQQRQPRTASAHRAWPHNM
jgi:hypothetical protein